MTEQSIGRLIAGLLSAAIFPLTFALVDSSIVETPALGVLLLFAIGMLSGLLIGRIWAAVYVFIFLWTLFIVGYVIVEQTSPSGGDEMDFITVVFIGALVIVPLTFGAAVGGAFLAIRDQRRS